MTFQHGLFTVILLVYIYRAFDFVSGIRLSVAADGLQLVAP